MVESMDKIVNLCKARGYIYPGSEIYGGLANTWDYGPLGAEFKNNVKKAWMKKFVQESKYNVGLDAAILMNPETWVASGHVGGFSDPLIDCKAAVRYLKAHADAFCVDRNRICVMGESAGGTMASLLGVTGGIPEYEKGDCLEEDSRVNAVVDFYSLTDLTDAPMSSREDIPEWALQDFLGVGYSKETAERASAIHYVDASVPPFLILHGSGDTLVPVRQSEALYNRLQEQGIYSELYILKDAPHGADEFYQQEILDRILAFLEKTLGETR